MKKIFLKSNDHPQNDIENHSNIIKQMKNKTQKGLGEIKTSKC